MANFTGQRQSPMAAIGRVMNDPTNGIFTAQQYVAPQTQVTPMLPPNTPAFGPSQGVDDPRQKNAILQAFQTAQGLGQTPAAGDAFVASQLSGVDKAKAQIEFQRRVSDALHEQAKSARKPLQKPGRSRWDDEQPGS